MALNAAQTLRRNDLLSEVFFPFRTVGMHVFKEMFFFGDDQPLNHFTLRYAVTFCQALSRSLLPSLIAEYKMKLLEKKLLEEKLHEFYALDSDLREA
jgi:hypothetical protein